MTSQTAKSTLVQLSTAIQQIDSRVLLVPVRVLQRIIRFDRRLSTLDLAVPHADCYFISRERLIDFTTRYEYQLSLARNLPDTLILLPAPEEDVWEKRTVDSWLAEYWRLLFHVRVHLEYRQLAAAGKLSNDQLLDRLKSIGEIPFAEARAVLSSDECLLPPVNYLSTYIEFAAIFLELWYFAPPQLKVFFPSICDDAATATSWFADIDHVRLYQATRPKGFQENSLVAEREFQPTNPSPGEAVREGAESVALSAQANRQWLARSERLDRLGNFVKAAIVRRRAARRAPDQQGAEAHSLSRTSLARFADRLAGVLHLSTDQATELCDALQPVLDRADRGFRQIESRLLYDLQKVCAEQERGVYAVDLVPWVASLGRTPLRRPLPLLREVLVTRHLRAALQKLQNSALSPGDRQPLLNILKHCVEQAEQLLRDQVRPVVQQIFADEGCRPQTVVEITAVKKIVEEILDRVVEQGQLSMGHLRDSISQSNMKLPDLLRIRELFIGDQLLRIDRRLANALDGVYHRGPVYLRMSHLLSSLAFGTTFGRIVSRYMVLPFGGAYLVLESFQHVLHFFFPLQTRPNGDELGHAATAISEGLSIATPRLPVTALSFVLVFGIFLMMLIENPAFRGWCLQQLIRFGRFWLYFVRDLPELILRLSWVRRVIESPWYFAFISYLFKPLAITALGLLFLDRILQWLPDRRIVSAEQLASVPQVLPLVAPQVWWLITFLAVNLFLNSPVGRYADALLMDHLRHGWRELRMRVFGSIFRFIVDSFQWMLRAIEQIIYTVDELLRFRTGEQWPMIVVKAVLGLFWSVVSYLVRIYITLLIEPQINPIKHFPVVTVSHKMILPFSIELTNRLALLLPLGSFFANTVAGTTVFLLPGVFGFLAWELKENWRLYAANRSQHLNSISIGSHGESMTRLLRPGFHSGTIPKIYDKARRTWRKSVQRGLQQTAIIPLKRLAHVEHSIRVFFEREWIALLQELPTWQTAELRIASVRISTNEIAIEIARGETAEEKMHIVFADLGGWLIARVVQPGWSAELAENQRQSLELAIQGVYRYAGIDLVWDDLLRGLGLASDPHWYDVNRDGMLVWTDRRFDGCIQYKLRDTGASETLSPQPKFISAPRREDLVSIVYSQTNISWHAWVEAWQELAHADAGSRSSLADSNLSSRDRS